MRPLLKQMNTIFPPKVVHRVEERTLVVGYRRSSSVSLRSPVVVTAADVERGPRPVVAIEDVDLVVCKVVQTTIRQVILIKTTVNREEAERVPLVRLMGVAASEAWSIELSILHLSRRCRCKLD
jgi:hypothetical protein